jgi:hypothetical protein
MHQTHSFDPVGICSIQAGVEKTRVWTDVKTFMIKAGEHKAFTFEDHHQPHLLKEQDVNYAYRRSKETDGREAQLPALEDFPHR